MKPKCRFPRVGSEWRPACVAFLTLAMLPGIGSGQAFERAMFRLLGGSTLTEECGGCSAQAQVLRGTFEMVLEESNPLVSTYAVTNVSFTSPDPQRRMLGGHGRYTTGGEVAIQQHMSLTLTREGFAPVYLSNALVQTDKLFPLVTIALRSDNAGSGQVLLNLVAAPAREIWFSTASSFTPAAGGPRGQGGDLLSDGGTFIQTASNLVATLGLPAAAFPVHLDAMDIQPGGEVWFSLTESQPVSRFGQLQHGDLLSNRGRIVVRNQELTAAFGVMPVVPDVGLDAVHIGDDGEILFSSNAEIFSERLGRMLRRGDLLSNRGLIVADNAQLLARFQPTTTDDLGLDAVYLWPSGEIWFSVEQGFQDRQRGPIGPGDVLSSQGIVVERNLDLLAAFAPIEDLADFGLDALFVVTDLRAAAAGPRLSRAVRENHHLHLEWQGLGRVFQVHRAGHPEGPYAPISPALPTGSFDDLSATNDAAFYRILQW